MGRFSRLQDGGVGSFEDVYEFADGGWQLGTMPKQVVLTTQAERNCRVKVQYRVVIE